MDREEVQILQFFGHRHSVCVDALEVNLCVCSLTRYADGDRVGKNT